MKVAHRISRAAAAALVLATALTVPWVPSTRAQLALAPGDPAPRLVGWNLSGRAQEIEWHEVNLVNYWAPWCEPCRLEMPELQRLHTERAVEGLQIIGMVGDLGVEADEVKRFVDQAGVTYAVLLPHKKFHKAWGGIAVVPTSFLIDGEGTILRRYSGAKPAQLEGMVRDLNDALDGRPLAPLVMVDP
jgi:thiol-disulfide isomerase/thioredoxin